MARTITGTLYFVSGDAAAALGVTFIPEDTPSSVGGTIIAGMDKRVATSSLGALPTLTLEEGSYIVRLDNGEEFAIDVPGGVGTSDISDLIVPPNSAANTAYQAAGHGSPEGVFRGNPGRTYLDQDTGDFWVKKTGTGTTGWLREIEA